MSVMIAAVQVATAESMLQQAQHTLQRWQELLSSNFAAPPANVGDGADGNIALVCQTCSYAIQRTESTGAWTCLICRVFSKQLLI